MKKKIYIISIFVIIIFLPLTLSSSIKIYIADIIKPYFPEKIYDYILFFSDNDRSRKRIHNNYNVHFLPETEQLNLKFKKIKLDFLKAYDQGYFTTYRTKTFYLALNDNKETLLIATKDGRIFYAKYNNLINQIEIDNNLTKNESQIKDIIFDNDDVFISSVNKVNNCYVLRIYKGKFNFEKINFQKVFEINDCVEDIQAGKLAIFKKNNQKFLLLATASEIIQDKYETSPAAQNDKSLWGKILLIDLNNYNYVVFSKGHRNILGLIYSETDNKIISTENGPRGGDEINIIEQGKNYGWDIASYGTKYREYNRNLIYKDHEEQGFQEPIFAFIPSIGISQITKITDDFEDVYWNNCFLIASLQNKKILRIKFDKKFNKVLFVESIFVGERIRDIKYIKNKKIIVMALENSGSLGILEKQ